MMLRLAILLAAVLSNPFVLAHQTVETLIEQEKLQRQNVVQLTAPDEKTYVKALISLHGELLEADKKQRTLVVNIDDEQVKTLDSMGFSIEPATRWLSERDHQLQQTLTSQSNVQANANTIPNFPCYATVEGTFNEAKSLATQYPQLAEMIDIGDSWQKTMDDEGYDLWVMKLTNQNITKDKPKLFIHSAMHAREYSPAALTLDFARDILLKYETDPDAHWILNEHEIHILFHMNPDGRKIAETGVLWRKNNNINHCPQQRPGVDLNRNFSHNWGVSEDGSSGDACDDVFRGPSPSSEPETAAVENYVRSLYEDRRGPNDNDAAPADTSGMYIDIHSFSELILWPWGHTNEPTPNGEALSVLGRKIAFFNSYIPTQSIGLYPTDGTSFSIGYGELGVASIAYELGTQFFQNCTAYENIIRPQNIASLYYAAKVVALPYQLPFGPDITDVTTLSNDPSSVVISLRVDDTRFNNTFGGTLQAQNIDEVEYYIDEFPAVESGSGIGLSASDGNFDSTSERIEASIDVTDLAVGQHIVYFRAKDASNNWGPVSAQFFDVNEEVQNAAPVPVVQTNCTDLVCELDASQSSDDGTIVSYQWSISDNTELSGETVTHTFSSSGTYDVVLTVTDNNEVEANTTESITVSEPPPPPTPVPDEPSTDSSGGGSLAIYSYIFLVICLLMRRAFYQPRFLWPNIA